jgi:ZIP family zinc transporter
MIILIAIATLISTFLGGLFALRLKDKLHLILGFSAGAVIAVAFFDLLPESLDLGNKFYADSTVLSVAALGFLVYLILDRIIFLHMHDDHDVSVNDHDATISSDHVDGSHGTLDAQHGHSAQNRHSRGILGAGSLSVHSFLDGVAIGLAFQVSASVGLIVAVAVLVHDFSDGINTVNMILKNAPAGEHDNGAVGKRSDRLALKWLMADAIAPVIGVISTMFFTVPEQALSIILALFSGFFLYIGASDLIPESYHAHPKFMTTIMTLLGAGILYIAIHLAIL